MTTPFYIFQRVREGSTNGEAQWNHWNTLLEAHGLFDSKGQCKPAAISVLSPVASDCWGTFFIVWDLVKTARKFAAPFHECVILHGPGEHYSAREDEFHAQFLG